MSRSLAYFLILLGFTAVGCNQCGERRKLFPRLNDALTRDDDEPSRLDSRRNGNKDCGPEGFPVSRNGGYGGEVIYSGPSYPAGQPYRVNPRSDELPAPGGYIPSPGVPPYPAIPRAIDSKLLPKTGGTMTGDSKK